jgi:hypothetical protein
MNLLMNKFRLIVVLLAISSQLIEASPPRKKTEVGIFTGTSFYMGEINPDRLFYNPSLSFGGLFRWRLSGTYALRGQILYGQFSANDKDFNNPFQLNRNASFSSSLLDFNAIIEYNFLPFQFNERKKTFSPYLFLGVGYDFIISSSNNIIGNHFNIPFGAGIKYFLHKNIIIGAEWGFRKLLTDKADGVTNPGGNAYKSTFSNKDWYSFTGFFITFGLFGNQGDCPVYQ